MFIFDESIVPDFKEIFIKKSGIENINLLSSWIEDSDIISSFGNSNIVNSKLNVLQDKKPEWRVNL